MLKGNLSGREIGFDTTLIGKLIDAYIKHVPGELRETVRVFESVRFYDELLRVLAAEEKAGMEMIEKRALKEEDPL